MLLQSLAIVGLRQGPGWEPAQVMAARPHSLQHGSACPLCPHAQQACQITSSTAPLGPTASRPAAARHRSPAACDRPHALYRSPPPSPSAQSTVVSKQGKGSNPKTTLYVGGLEASVNEASLHAAFLPFGDIKEVGC